MTNATTGGQAPPSLDRARGALLGLAVGDALGTTLEFSRRDSLPYHTQMTGSGPFRLAPGQWTDDTSMALALADSLLACGGLDPDDLMTRFVAWWRTGAYACTGACFDIGNTTRQALAAFERDGDPFAGPTAEDQAGNGSLMRLAPVVLFALDDPETMLRLAIDQGRTTHEAPQAVEACAYFATLLRDAILGEPDPLQPRAWTGHRAIETIAADAWRTKDRALIRSSDYVAHTLEAALWCVGTTASFEEALVLAVNLGDDADTVGAVTGQLAGGLYGAAAIPENWLTPLAWRERLDEVAVLLVPERLRRQVPGKV